MSRNIPRSSACQYELKCSLLARRVANKTSASKRKMRKARCFCGGELAQEIYSVCRRGYTFTSHSYFNYQAVNLFARLLLLFIVVPLTDLFLLMLMSRYTGWPFSIGMVVVSGVVGAWLAKQSYRGVIAKIRQRVGLGRVTSDLMTDGAMIFFAAGLLLTPGFITDIVGFSLLIPACRRWYKTRITNWAKKNFKFEMVQMPTYSNKSTDPNTVDGEVLNKTRQGTESSESIDKLESP